MDTQRNIYMVGIGGIGMSALAQLFKHQGAHVVGSDRSDSPTTKLLKEKGIEVYIGHSAAHVPQDLQMLVYSDAVVEGSEGYVERACAREFKIPEMNYFEALGKVAEGKQIVAIAGTHGKTTTTAMIGKILVDAGLDPTVVIGSISADFGSNFRAGTSDIFVVEACEYRNHFLNFHPKILIITNIEFDHTDFFQSLTEVEAAFAEARKQATTVIEYEQYAKEHVPELLLPGEFNKENARAAKAAVRAIAPHVPEEVIDNSLKTCKGTWRRFEYKGKTVGGADLYDDYAHHPTAIKKTIEAAKEKFPDKKIVIAFHPHLFSRTRDLFSEFIDALSVADMVFVLPIFAARETPDPAISHDILAQEINKKGGHAEAVSGLIETTKKLSLLGLDTVAFTMGAGDVYKAGEEALKK